MIIESFKDKVQILIGSLLGDGCIQKRGNSYAYRETHGLKQKDYLIWKQKYLPFEAGVKVNEHRVDPAIFLWSRRASTFLKPYYFEKYKVDDRPLKLVKNLEVLGLLVWLLDDATIHYTGNAVYIDLLIYNIGRKIDKMTADSILGIISDKFSISGNVLIKKGYGYYISFSVLETRRLLNLFISYVPILPECVYYKLGLSDGKFIHAKKRQDLYYSKNREKLINYSKEYQRRHA